MTAASLPTVAFQVQAALRTVLLAWAPLDGIDVATGPRRKELIEGITIARPKSHTTAQTFEMYADDGTVTIVADAFVAGAGEVAIDLARARAALLLAEALAAVRVNTGDHTIGGLVLSCASSLDFEEVDSYTEEPGARIAGHGYTIACTIDYTARVVPIGGS